MEILFIVGTVLLIIAIIIHVIVVKMAWNRFHSAKAEDFLEKYYEEQGND